MLISYAYHILFKTIELQFIPQRYENIHYYRNKKFRIIQCLNSKTKRAIFPLKIKHMDTQNT